MIAIKFVFFFEDQRLSPLPIRLAHRRWRWARSFCRRWAEMICARVSPRASMCVCPVCRRARAHGRAGGARGGDGGRACGGQERLYCCVPRGLPGLACARSGSRSTRDRRPEPRRTCPRARLSSPASLACPPRRNLERQRVCGRATSRHPIPPFDRLVRAKFRGSGGAATATNPRRRARACPRRWSPACDCLSQRRAGAVAGSYRARGERWNVDGMLVRTGLDSSSSSRRPCRLLRHLRPRAARPASPGQRRPERLVDSEREGERERETPSGEGWGWSIDEKGGG